MAYFWFLLSAAFRGFARSVGWKLGAIAVAVLLAGVGKAFAQTVECAGACTVTVVHQLNLAPFAMSVEDGALLSGLILSVWISALVFRFFIRTLRDKGEE